MAIKEKNFIQSSKVDGIELSYHKDGFCVQKDNSSYKIPSYNVSKELRHRSKEELRSYLKTGCLELKRMSDASYKIEGHQRGLGAGPFTGMVFGLVTAVGGCAGTLAATIVSIPSTGPGCIFVLAAGAAATTKATIAATIVGGALPLP